MIYRTGRFEFDQDAKGFALGVREIDPHLEVLKSFCEFLTEMGAKITGVGTSILTIEGVDTLSGAKVSRT